jgi:hypothetical protein
MLDTLCMNIGLAPPMIRKFISFICFIMLSSGLVAQNSTGQPNGYRLPYIIEGEDTIPVVNLATVNIEDKAGAEYLKNLQAYYRLRFNVIKVYPYARLAAVKLNEMNIAMSAMKNDRERRRYRKSVEDQVRKDFEEQVKKLSVNQGKVLIKLIDRETGHTSYELIKDLKGSLSAFFAQNMAKLFGHNLREEYDPEGNDQAIENVVKQIERGEITF